MSEETNELQSNPESISSEEFEARLTEFFNHHKESKLKLVSRIAQEFKGQENIVLEHLHNKYVLKIVSEKPKKKHLDKAEGQAEEPSVSHENKEVAKPKSKKKLILIIIVSILVVGLGVGGYFMKDKILGKHGETPSTEAKAAESKPAVEEPKKEEVPAEAVPTDSAQSMASDSSISAPDSTQEQK